MHWILLGLLAYFIPKKFFGVGIFNCSFFFSSHFSGKTMSLLTYSTNLGRREVWKSGETSRNRKSFFGNDLLLPKFGGRWWGGGLPSLPPVSDCPAWWTFPSKLLHLSWLRIAHCILRLYRKLNEFSTAAQFSPSFSVPAF